MLTVDSDIMSVRRSAVPYSSQTVVPLLFHEPGDVSSIRDECLQLQSNVMNGQDVSGPVSE